MAGDRLRSCISLTYLELLNPCIKCTRTSALLLSFHQTRSLALMAVGMSLPSLVSFGALAPLPAPEKLHQLRYSLLQQQSLKPIVQAVNELPQLWKSLLNEDPSLNSIAGEAAANQLSQWVEGSAQIAKDKGNMIRMPVTIIGQIAQYITYLCQSDEPIEHESIIRSVAVGGGIQGLCIGLLSALAVASSKTDQDVGHFAAVSVLLAFCVGAYIDLDEHRGHDGAKTSTLAVRWRTPILLDDIQRIVGRHQNVSFFPVCQQMLSSCKFPGVQLVRKFGAI